MINLFPLPYWAPALLMIPTPLRVLNEAFTQGRRSFAKDADKHPAFSRRKPMDRGKIQSPAPRRHKPRGRTKRLGSSDYAATA
jgi:hypothetical protein